MKDYGLGIVGIVALLYSLIIGPAIYLKFYRKRKKGTKFKGIEAIKFFSLFSILPGLLMMVLLIILMDVRDFYDVIVLVFFPLSVGIVNSVLVYGLAYFLTKYVTKKPMEF